MTQQKCFVIMGYGIKTDPLTGRELDLDKTYKNLIKPAVEAAGLKCIRADEIIHSGIIDVPMYQHLLDADVVVADLSTNNPNALYELGVRHALRPFTTISIAEKELKYPFDVNHTVIMPYEHLGKDIGCDEARRFEKELKESILLVLQNPNTDSPVYTYLNGLIPPRLNISPPEIQTNPKESLSTIVSAAKDALDNENFVIAKNILHTALYLDPNSTYVTQKLALATYKSKIPNHVSSLNEAFQILEPLKPDSTTDPETLGLSGAIHKRLWEETGEYEKLNKAIHYYEKGFYIRNDYYNGINLAYLLNVRGYISVNNDAITDYTLGNRIRTKVIDICEHLRGIDFDQRSDQYWIIATLEEAYFGLGNTEKYKEMKSLAQKFPQNNWERETTEDQIYKLNKLLERSPLI